MYECIMVQHAQIYICSNIPMEMGWRTVLEKNLPVESQEELTNFSTYLKNYSFSKRNLFVAKTLKLTLLCLKGKGCAE